MAAASGVKRTRVGYCGGTTPNPTYRKVCSDKAFADWAEAVQVDFDPAVISYEELVGVFFQSHEPGMCGGKRQYMSAIFPHSPDQLEAAQRVFEKEKAQRKGRLGTSVEMATDFYTAELYHQKWLLQRKADWFKAVGLADGDQLLESEAACKVNAFVAGHLPASALRDDLDRLAQTENLPKPVWSSLRTKLRMDGCEGDD